MIILYTGRRGSGKTLTMIKDIVKYYNNGWEILSNIHINNIKYKYITYDDVININKNSKINNAVIVLDEIQVMFDSRRSGSKENKEFSNFIQQIRKRNLIVLCTTQFAGTTDLRIRQHTDVICRPRFNKKYLVTDAYYYDVTSSEDDFYNEGVYYKHIIFDARSVFNFYDTKEKII